MQEAQLFQELPTTPDPNLKIGQRFRQGHGGAVRGMIPAQAPYEGGAHALTFHAQEQNTELHWCPGWHRELMVRRMHHHMSIDTRETT